VGHQDRLSQQVVGQFDCGRPKLLFRASVTWLTHRLPVPP
jgi:hypothetical protein